MNLLHLSKVSCVGQRYLACIGIRNVFGILCFVVLDNNTLFVLFDVFPAGNMLENYIISQN